MGRGVYLGMTYQEYLRAMDCIGRLADEACASPETARAFIKSLGGKLPRLPRRKAVLTVTPEAATGDSALKPNGVEKR